MKNPVSLLAAVSLAFVNPAFVGPASAGLRKELGYKPPEGGPTLTPAP